MKALIPESALNQHIAVLGKTGSGKTSTGKLIVEHVVRDNDSRVCILDPIKSDWWGLTLDRDGKRPGLPFHILGGPQAHVPLHAAAGSAIGHVVATGALRHSIIDMADFSPGEPQRFFVAFAQSLFRHVQGMLYLVVEEAHVFAPKERAGFGDENMALHWMNRLSSAARSKGIRLIVLTQRTQKLHNEVLSSCETIIPHRLTFPADQKPVGEWIRGHSGAETEKKVLGSLATLNTGTGWVCFGESVEIVKFPRIATYDNTATPTGDVIKAVKAAPVDQDKLRSIIGDAVKEAEANDPKHLRAKIAELSKQVDKSAKSVQTDQQIIEKAVAAALAKRDREWQQTVKERDGIIGTLKSRMDKAAALLHVNGEATPKVINLPDVKITSIAPIINQKARNITKPAVSITSGEVQATGSITARQQRFLDSAATLTTLGTEVSRETIAAWNGIHPRTGSYAEDLKALADLGLISNDRGTITVTTAGMAAAAQLDAAEAIDRAKSGLSARQRKFFETIVDVYPDWITREQIAEQFSLHPRTGSLAEDLSALAGRGLVDRQRGSFRARDFLLAPIYLTQKAAQREGSE